MKRRKICSFAAGMVLCLIFSFAGVWAKDPVMADKAGLYSSSEKQRLEQEAKNVGERIGAELVFLTLNENTGMTGVEYAKEYLLTGGYGYGDGRESILFLIDMYQREYTVYEYNDEASGYLLTDDEGDRILDRLEKYMVSGNYYGAAKEFLEACEFYAGVTIGGNYDSGKYDSGRSEYRTRRPVNWIFCLGIGLVGGGIVTSMLVSKRNKDEKVSAGRYSDENYVETLAKQDVFVNTTVVKRKIETNSGSSASNRSHSSGSRGFSGGNRGGGHGGSRKF